MPTLKDELQRIGLAKKSKEPNHLYSQVAVLDMEDSNKRIKSSLRTPKRSGVWLLKTAKSGRCKIMVSPKTHEDINKKSISYLVCKSLYLRDTVTSNEIEKAVETEANKKPGKGSISSILTRIKQICPEDLKFNLINKRKGQYSLTDKRMTLDDFYLKFNNRLRVVEKARLNNKKVLGKKLNVKEMKPSASISETITNSIVSELVKEVKIKIEVSGNINFIFKLER